MILLNIVPLPVIQDSTYTKHVYQHISKSPVTIAYPFTTPILFIKFPILLSGLLLPGYKTSRKGACGSVVERSPREREVPSSSLRRGTDVVGKHR